MARWSRAVASGARSVMVLPAAIASLAVSLLHAGQLRDVLEVDRAGTALVPRGSRAAPSRRWQTPDLWSLGEAISGERESSQQLAQRGLHMLRTAEPPTETASRPLQHLTGVLSSRFTVRMGTLSNVGGHLEPHVADQCIRLSSTRHVVWSPLPSY